MFVLDGISPKIWFLSSHFAILLFFTSYFTVLNNNNNNNNKNNNNNNNNINNNNNNNNNNNKTVVFKYRVGVRRGIAVSHGQVGVFSLGWQPS